MWIIYHLLYKYTFIYQRIQNFRNLISNIAILKSKHCLLLCRVSTNFVCSVSMSCYQKVMRNRRERRGFFLKDESGVFTPPGLGRDQFIYQFLVWKRVRVGFIYIYFNEMEGSKNNKEGLATWSGKGSVLGLVFGLGHGKRSFSVDLRLGFFFLFLLLLHLHSRTIILLSNFFKLVNVLHFRASGIQVLL